MKYREFWISTETLDDTESPVFHADPDGPTVHVIEYEAYQDALAAASSEADRGDELGDKYPQLLEQANKLAKALEKYRHIGSNQIQDVGKEPITAEEALAEWNKFKQQI